MPTDAAYFIDSNIFFNAKVKDKKYGESCSRILADLVNGQISALTSTLVLLEVGNAMRKFGLAQEVQEELNAIYSTGIPVYEILNVDIRLVGELFSKTGLSPYDCAHVAVMKRAGLDRIISTDGDFDEMPGLARLDPLNYQKTGPKRRRA